MKSLKLEIPNNFSHIFASSMQTFSVHITRFIILLLFQAIVLNNLNIHGLLNPYIYPLFIILLPINISAGILLLLGFVIGVSVDIFSDSLGIHAFTCVMVAFLRPLILKALAPAGGYNAENNPSIKSMGFSWFATYTAIVVLIHHTVLFFIEVLTFTDFWWTMLKIILSSIFSIALIFIWEYLFYPKKK